MQLGALGSCPSLPPLPNPPLSASPRSSGVLWKRPGAKVAFQLPGMLRDAHAVCECPAYSGQGIAKWMCPVAPENGNSEGSVESPRALTSRPWSKLRPHPDLLIASAHPRLLSVSCSLHSHPLCPVLVPGAPSPQSCPPGSGCGYSPPPSLSAPPSPYVSHLTSIPTRALPTSGEMNL